MAVTIDRLVEGVEELLVDDDELVVLEDSEEVDEETEDDVDIEDEYELDESILGVIVSVDLLIFLGGGGFVARLLSVELLRLEPLVSK